MHITSHDPCHKGLVFSGHTREQAQNMRAPCPKAHGWSAAAGLSDSIAGF